VFLRTETGSAVVLLGTAVAALAWVNISASSYDAVWGARLSVRLVSTGVSLDLREWVNSGLMTFFFFVFGLEARREFDLGELRERTRLALPVAAGLGSPRHCPRTSGSSSFTIPGPATSSSRCSRSPTPASRSAARSSPAPTPPPSPWASSLATSPASRSALPARRGCSPA
jgi:hypothetical protein